MQNNSRRKAPFPAALSAGGAAGPGAKMPSKPVGGGCQTAPFGAVAQVGSNGECLSCYGQHNTEGFTLTMAVCCNIQTSKQTFSPFQLPSIDLPPFYRGKPVFVKGLRGCSFSPPPNPLPLAEPAIRARAVKREGELIWRGLRPLQASPPVYADRHGRWQFRRLEPRVGEMNHAGAYEPHPLTPSHLPNQQ